MAKIRFEVGIGNEKISSFMELTGQDLYYFEQRKEEGGVDWIKSYLEKKMKISNVEIEKER